MFFSYFMGGGGVVHLNFYPLEKKSGGGGGRPKYLNYEIREYCPEKNRVLTAP